MRYWWVNQNQTYRHEVMGGYTQPPTPVLHVSEPGSDADRSAEFRDLRERLAADLRNEIAGMSLDNFLVRPKRRRVEKYESCGQAIRPDRSRILSAGRASPDQRARARRRLWRGWPCYQQSSTRHESALDR